MEDLKANESFIIVIKDSERDYYLGHRDGIMTRIRNAVFYHDNMYAKSELQRVIDEYKATDHSFLNKAENLVIKKVEINIVV